MDFGQNYSLELPAEWLQHMFWKGSYGQNNVSSIFSNMALLYSKNYNSQPSRKLPGPWAGGAYRLTLGLTIGE